MAEGDINPVVAVAISLWAAGFIKMFTQFEKLDILGASFNGEHSAFEILVRNTGSKPVVIAGVGLNGVPLDISVWDPVDDPNLTAIYDPVGAPCELVSVDGDKVARCDPGESIVILICPHFGGIEVKSGVLYEIVIASGGGCFIQRLFTCPRPLGPGRSNPPLLS